MNAPAVAARPAGNAATRPAAQPAVARRLARLLGKPLAVLAVVALVGMLPLLSGRDPARAILQARSAGRKPDSAALQAVREELGLDAGPLGLLLEWLAGLVRGDLGVSWVSGTPIGPEVWRALGVSATLTGWALAVALALALLLVVRPLADGLRGVNIVPHSRAGAVLAALPEFLIASVLLTLVATRLEWLPTSGWEGPRNAILPAIALGIPTGAVLGTVLADGVRGALAEPWVPTWRGAGLGASRLVTAALRRAMSVVCGQLALITAGLLGGAVAVEEIFAVPGMGRLVLDAALARDVPVVRACVLVLLVCGVLAGVVGAAGQRVLLGPALREGVLSAAPAARVRRGGVRLIVLVGGLVTAVIMAGLLRDPTAIDVAARLAPPSWQHPLGTDATGRDLLARVGHGALRTVGLAVLVTAVAFVVGVLVGVLPGSARSGSSFDIVNAVPATVVGLVAAAIVGPGALGAALAVVSVRWAPLAAHSRALATEQRASPHVGALRALGASEARVLCRHVIPAVAAPVARNALVRLPATAIALASLAFLGLGPQPPAPSWGVMLSEALPYIERAPWTVLAPAAGFVLLGLAASTLSRRLR